MSSSFEEALPPCRLIPTVVGSIAVRETIPDESVNETIVFWPSILADYHIYQTPIESWRDKHRLIIIDGPGHGDSGEAPKPFTMKDCSKALYEILDSLGISKRVIIVGCSWGGLVAGEFAIDYPSRTKAIVMLNVPIHNNKGLRIGDRFVVYGSRWLHGTSTFQDGVARSFFLPKTRQDKSSAFMKPFYQHLKKANGKSLALSVRSVLLDREPLAPRMNQITVSTLFIAGRFDTMYPPETLREAVSSVPRGRFELIETSHISVVDEPGITTKLMSDFIATL